MSGVRTHTGWIVAAGILLAAGAAAAGGGPDEPEPAGTDEGSCIACHRDPDFLVTHPKLYQYFRDWERSIHHQEGVTCSDCHGGRPDVASREGAHAGMFRSDSARSAVNFANVPATCGSCHDHVEAAYRESAHFEHLVGAAGEGGDGKGRQGPSCVTCHRSMNTLTLDVTTVEETCAKCHGEDNHPEIPAEARRTLNQFLSIDRFYRYIAVRAHTPAAREFLAEVDVRREALSVLWHTFDLDRIHAATLEILDDLRAKRDEIRERSRKAEEGSGASAR